MVTPALVADAAAAGRRGGAARDSPLVTLCKRAVPPRCLPPLVAPPVGDARRSGRLSVGGLALLIPLLGEELMPKFKETDFLMHWVEKPASASTP